MAVRGESLRFWIPAVALLGFMAYNSQALLRAHLTADVKAPQYEFERSIPGRRGSVFDKGGADCPLVKSVPVWEYRLDPVALTNAVVRRKGEPPRKPEAIVRTVANCLRLDYGRVLAMSRKTGNRYQYLSQSADEDVHRILADSRLVAGVVIEDRQVRQYLNGRRLCHVLGSVNAQGEPSAGIELRFNRELAGVPGMVRGKKDARGRELYDKRIEAVAPIPGADVYLTIDHNLQYETESALAWGVREFDAGSGWAVVLDSKTGAILALASLPDFNPLSFGRSPETARINRVVGYTYEPGSVMKVITACAALETGVATGETMYSTDRKDERYYRLPGDGSHVWDAEMSVRDAIVHSSNIVIGKLGCDIGPERLWTQMKAFGFGARTGVELPGEEVGILRDWRRWDKATWSRAPIGQAVSVTAIQLASAYQAIANDGLRVPPHIVERVVGADGSELYRPPAGRESRPVSAATSRAVREMMLGVASSSGTARRAAIRGYSVAGKTGTAQKAVRGRYADGLYRATFCGIVPSGVVRRREEDPAPAPARLVILVTLDFEKRTKYHQGGNSSAPVFRRIATAALRYMGVEPDRPEELMEYYDDDEFDSIMDERARDIGIHYAE